MGFICQANVLLEKLSCLILSQVQKMLLHNQAVLYKKPILSVMGKLQLWEYEK